MKGHVWVGCAFSTRFLGATKTCAEAHPTKTTGKRVCSCHAEAARDGSTWNGCVVGPWRDRSARAGGGAGRGGVVHGGTSGGGEGAGGRAVRGGRFQGAGSDERLVQFALLGAVLAGALRASAGDAGERRRVAGVL